MERNWWIRAGLVVAALAFSLYQLVPSWFYFRTPPEKRGGLDYE